MRRDDKLQMMSEKVFLITKMATCVLRNKNTTVDTKQHNTTPDFLQISTCCLNEAVAAFLSSHQLRTAEWRHQHQYQQPSDHQYKHPLHTGSLQTQTSNKIAMNELRLVWLVSVQFSGCHMSKLPTDSPDAQQSDSICYELMNPPRS